MQTWTTVVLVNQISFPREPPRSNFKHHLFYSYFYTTSRDELRCNYFGRERELFGPVLTDLDA